MHRGDIYIYMCRRALLQGLVFHTGIVGLVKTSVNLGAGPFSGEEKAGSKTKRMSKKGSLKMTPNPRHWDCRTERARKRHLCQKQRREDARCCSLRNQKVQEVKQKQIRWDARQEADMTRSEAHRKQTNTKKPYFPWKTVFFSCFSVPPPLCFYPFLSFIFFVLSLSLSLHCSFFLVIFSYFLYFIFISEFLAQLASNLQKWKTLKTRPCMRTRRHIVGGSACIYVCMYVCIIIYMLWSYYLGQVWPFWWLLTRPSMSFF